jgi:hypothetical protein
MKRFEVLQRVAVIVPCVATFHLLHELAECVQHPLSISVHIGTPTG